MRSAPVLDIDDIDVFDQITAAKHILRRVHLIAARPAVLDAYERYFEATPEIGDLEHAALSDPQKEALIHAFTVATAPMTALRGRIMNRVAVARCPFCGISESSTLDHYLPKEQYPEFAVYTLNLVPACSPCNTRKRDMVIDENTDVRVFVHPYFDEIPAASFLIADVQLADNAIALTFRLRRPTGLAIEVFRQLRSHFQQLDLADRYRRMALEHLGGQYRALKRAYGPTEDAERVAEELTNVANDFAQLYGENYWLAVLYRALAECEDFCDGGFDVLQGLH